MSLYAEFNKDEEDVLKRFFQINPHMGQGLAIQRIRSHYVELAQVIMREVPRCADRTAALRDLRLSSFMAISAICFDWPEESE